MRISIQEGIGLDPQAVRVETKDVLQLQNTFIQGIFIERLADAPCRVSFNPGAVADPLGWVLRNAQLAAANLPDENVHRRLPD